MIDLKVVYENENGEQVEREYDTIMDFIDEMESDEIDIPMLDYGNVTATFFENKLNVKHCETIGELLEHCKNITR